MRFPRQGDLIALMQGHIDHAEVAVIEIDPGSNQKSPCGSRRRPHFFGHRRYFVGRLTANSCHPAGLDLVAQLLAFLEAEDVSALDCGDVNNTSFDPSSGLDKAITLLRVEPFHGAVGHLPLLKMQSYGTRRDLFVSANPASPSLVLPPSPSEASMASRQLTGRRRLPVTVTGYIITRGLGRMYVFPPV